MVLVLYYYNTENSGCYWKLKKCLLAFNAYYVATTVFIHHRKKILLCPTEWEKGKDTYLIIVLVLFSWSGNTGPDLWNLFPSQNNLMKNGEDTNLPNYYYYYYDENGNFMENYENTWKIEYLLIFDHATTTNGKIFNRQFCLLLFWIRKIYLIYSWKWKWKYVQTQKCIVFGQEIELSLVVFDFGLGENLSR